ncbi:DNA helicase MCM9 [Pancytospora epiphaga]|nr:DNA helicase MCM9 [Pancytospora epiphaga]
MNEDAKSVINLIELCDVNPEQANSIITGKNAQLFGSQVVGVPCITHITQPLSARQLNRLVSVHGSVIRTYEVLFKNVLSEQVCLVCNTSSYVCEQDIKRRGQPICASCGSMSLRLTRDFQGAISSQSIRIQDIGNSRSMSETLEILLEGSTAGKFVPGDKVFVTGVVTRRWKQLRPNEPMLSTLILRAISISKEEEDDGSEIKPAMDEYMQLSSFERRCKLIESFSPSIVGLSACRLGILLAIANGGGQNTCSLGSPRSSIHILLVGDSGTGKSHLLKIASKLVSPAVFTNGVGTSDAGLTSCAMRQGREWSLEGGALVLADTGLCCIDEFHRLNVNEKSGLLEAMEQQTISVAKAGIVATLNTRCSIIAAASTRQLYNSMKTVSENLGLSTPLVSRFDLIFGLFDVRSESMDKDKADCILERDRSQKVQESLCWSLPALRAFITQCRRKPIKISEDLSDVVVRYYTKKRKIDGHSEFNTIRMLEGMMRLAEAHTKLMNKECAEEEDVYIAIILMELTVNATSKIDIDEKRVFVEDEYFRNVVKQLKKAYSL